MNSQSSKPGSPGSKPYFWRIRTSISLKLMRYAHWLAVWIAPWISEENDDG
jgi:hypothetical protein